MLCSWAGKVGDWLVAGGCRVEEGLNRVPHLSPGTWGYVQQASVSSRVEVGRKPGRCGQGGRIVMSLSYLYTGGGTPVEHQQRHSAGSLAQPVCHVSVCVCVCVMCACEGV